MSKQIRMAITLDDETRYVIEEFARAVDKPASTLVREFLVEMRPQFRDLTKYAIALKKGQKSKAQKAMRDLVGNTIAEQIEQDRRNYP